MAVTPWLLLVGLALAVVGSVDLILMWVPPRLGDGDWEFAAVAQTFDALPLSTIGILITAIALRLRGGSRAVIRLMAIVLGVGALFLVGALGLFALNVGTAARAIADPAVSPGLKRVIGKALVAGVVYITLYAGMSVMLWRYASTREQAAPSAAAHS